MKFKYLILFFFIFSCAENVKLINKEKKNSNAHVLSGNDNISWPLQAIHNYETYNKKIDDNFLNKIQNDYFESVKIVLESGKFKDSDWWKKCREEFKDLFFNIFFCIANFSILSIPTSVKITFLFFSSSS